MIFHAKFLEGIHWLIAVLLGIAAVVMFGLAMCGCTPTQAQVLTSVQIAEWTLPLNHALDVCREEAAKLPEGEQLKAYYACERAEVRKLCERKPALKGAWARCQAVMP